MNAKRILVTGGAGFIGSHLTERLLQSGASVTVLDDQSTGDRENLRIAEADSRFRFVQGSAGDDDLIRQLIQESDQVYHLAAAVGVALIAKQPIETIERNIYPTQLILGEMQKEAEKGRSVRLFVASTSEVYGKNPKPQWCEDDDLVFGSTRRARWSYGASKAIDEFLALAYWRQFRLPIVIGRFFNVVGPRQSGAYGMVVPRFVQAAISGKPLKVHDDGKQVRCFAHVDDVVRWVLQLMNTDDALGRVTNIGSDEPVSILELAQRVIAASDSSSQIEFQSYTDAYDEDFEDIRRRIPDVSRLRSIVDHRPSYDLDGIIRELVRETQSGDG